MTVDETCLEKPVRIRYADGEDAGPIGIAVAFSEFPMVCVRHDFGEQTWWRASLATVVDNVRPDELALTNRLEPMTITPRPLDVWARTTGPVHLVTDEHLDADRATLRVIRALLETSLENVNRALTETAEGARA